MSAAPDSPDSPDSPERRAAFAARVAARRAAHKESRAETRRLRGKPAKPDSGGFGDFLVTVFFGILEFIATVF